VKPPEDDFEARLVAAVDFLEGLGYMARLDREHSGEILIRIVNCPYEQVARSHREVCAMDLALLTRLLGKAPERIACAARDGNECVYLVTADGE